DQGREGRQGKSDHHDEEWRQGRHNRDGQVRNDNILDLIFHVGTQQASEDAAAYLSLPGNDFLNAKSELHSYIFPTRVLCTDNFGLLTKKIFKVRKNGQKYVAIKFYMKDNNL
ncbi:MAG: hypothetical protein IJT96_02210, partial [Lachnospiraceae bacterium]|nr:hypothetical protein [Lachnospiraceae bacterium]